MFERFTDRARRVVVLAQEEARVLRHSHIGTEHLLLGLVAEREGVGAWTLHAHDLDLRKVRAAVEKFVGVGQNEPTGHIPFTPRCKAVMELSLREALMLGHSYVGTEHLLLGLCREGEGIAAQIVKQADSLADIRSTCLRRLQQTATPPFFSTATTALPPLHLHGAATQARLEAVEARLTQVERQLRGESA